jgi:hypothetical protein
MSDDVEATRAAPAEVAPAAVTPAQPASARQGRARSAAVGLFFVLTCLSLILATTTWWLHETVLSTDHFVALTGDLASNPEVQAALVEVTVTQVDQALGLGPIGTYVVAGVAREVYASDAFAKVWEGAMRAVHTQVVKVLRGDSNLAQVEDGQIVVNLFPVIDAVFTKVNGLDLVIAGNAIALPDITNPDDPTASRAELSAALGRELKPTFGVVPIAPSAKLEAAQRYVTIFDALAIALWVITILLTGLTLVLARRRIRMVALLGIGGLVALLIARLVIASAADSVATAVAEGGAGAIIGGQVAQQIADSYREFARGGRGRERGRMDAGAPRRRGERRRRERRDRWVVPGARRTRGRPGRAPRSRPYPRHAGARRGRLPRLAGLRPPLATAIGGSRSRVVQEPSDAGRFGGVPAEGGPPVSPRASGGSSRPASPRRRTPRPSGSPTRSPPPEATSPRGEPSSRSSRPCRSRCAARGR